MTGIRQGFETDLAAFMSEAGRFTDLPKVLGFGISTPKQAAKLKNYAEGIMVGSAAVKLIADSGPETLLDDFSAFTWKLKNALI